ncbi:MAG: IS3 family transposase, partial [Planctomycetales bacterium]|nr:IS3 family transposase [Planctomycetales bacterium]
MIPDPAVLEKPVRRRFTAEYKLRILHEADRCTQPGQLGVLLRLEGLYSSHL